MTFEINNLDNIILNSQINENIAEHYLTKSNSFNHYLY